MAKIGRNARSGRFITVSEATRQPKSTTAETVKIKDVESGRELTLKGYGSMKGKFTVREGIDVSKPIAAQTLRPSNRSKK